MNFKRVQILGVPVDCVSREEALDRVETLLAGERPAAVIAVNPEKVIQALSNPPLLAQLREAGLLLPDGIGVVFAARLLGLGRMERVPGAELMPEICRKAAKCGYGVFLFGASPEVNREAAAALSTAYPGIRLVGSEHGFIPADQMPALVDRINASGARILVVALGSPRQEIWMRTYLPGLNVRICQGVGGTFDILAGRVKRAPILFRKMHLEWFYRLVSDPRRLLRQRALPKFAAQVLWRVVAG